MTIDPTEALAAYKAGRMPLVVAQSFARDWVTEHSQTLQASDALINGTGAAQLSAPASAPRDIPEEAWDEFTASLGMGGRKETKTK